MLKKIDDLISLLEKIRNELKRSANIDNVFWQVQAIIRENEKINKDDVFQEWIANTYVDSIAIRLRRLVDKRKGSVSLRRLLEEMKSFSGQLTRSRFIEMHDKGMGCFAQSWFDDIAGKGQKFVSTERINEKQKELLKKTEKVRQYTNDNVAHYSESAGKTKTTFEDVRRSLVSVFIIFNWCASLLESSPLITPVPYYQSDWTSVFKIPWIEEKDSIPQYKHLDEYIEEIKDG